MKRLLGFLFAIIFFITFFSGFASSRNIVSAATCSQILTSGFCVSRALEAECYRTSASATDCSSTQICCQADPPPACTSNGNVCDANGDCCSNYCTQTGQNKTCQPSATCKTTGQTCSNDAQCCSNDCAGSVCQSAEPNCIKHNQSGCNIGGDCCASENTMCSTSNTCVCPWGDSWNPATNKCVHYTCPDVNLQYCSPEPCDTETETSGSGTCGPNRTCCKAKEAAEGNEGSGVTTCQLCPVAYVYDPVIQKCTLRGEGQTYVEDVVTELCPIGHLCYPGCGCDNHGCMSNSNFTSRPLPCTENGTCETAVGTISTNPTSNNYLVKTIFRISLSLVGGIAVLLIMLSGFRIISSQGNPEKLQGAKEQLTAAIIGLLFVIFAYSILSFIGVDLLSVFPE